MTLVMANECTFNFIETLFFLVPMYKRIQRM